MKSFRKTISNPATFFFLLFLLASTINSCAPKPNAAFIVTVKPDGDTGDEREIVISFSRDMVRKNQIGEVSKIPLKFSPDISGKSRWRDEKTLVFTPSQNLTPSTSYTLTLSGKTTALDGNRLITDHSFSFHTTRISAEAVHIGMKNWALSKPVFRIAFTQPVAYEQIENGCRFVNDKNESHKVVLEQGQESGPTRSYRVLPVDNLTLNTQWNFACRAGIRGIEGNLGLDKEVIYDFKTYGPLTFEHMAPSGDDVVPSEELRFKIAFSNSLKKPYKLKIKPKVPGFPESCHALGGKTPGVDCDAMLEAHTKYTVTIDASQEDVFGQTLRKSQTVSFRTKDAEPTVSTESGYFVAELKRPVLPIWTRNVNEIDLTAVRLTTENFHQVRRYIDWWETDPADFSKSKIHPNTKTIKIEHEQNKWHELALDPAALFDKESGPGMYYLEVGADEAEHGHFSGGGKRKILVNFTDLGVVTKLSSIKGMVWTTRLSTGGPLAGAKITVRNWKGEVTWTGKSNHNGIAYLPPKETLIGNITEENESREEDEDVSFHEEPTDRINVFVEYGNDWTMVNAVRSGSLEASNFSGVFRDYGSETVRLRGYLHTNQGLYRPGDTVHFKGLVRETSLGKKLEVPKNKKGRLKILDPRNAIVDEQEVTISKFGGFWVDLSLPKDARLGNYTAIADFEHGSFSDSFSVEEFRPATFEVTGKTNRGRIVRRGKFQTQISANYLYGAPLREGDVFFTVHSRPRFVHFDQFKSFSFQNYLDHEQYHSRYWSQALITDEQLVLNNNGNVSHTVTITPDDIPGDAELLIQAGVTSPSNEKLSKSFTIPYFKARRYFGIKMPSDVWEKNKPFEFEVVGVKPSGQVALVSTNVTVKRRSYNCVWEDYGYRGSYRCSREEKEILKQEVTFEDGPVKLSFTPDKGGDYWILVDGKKVSGKPASQEVWVWGDDGAGEYLSEDRMTFDMVTDKDKYHVGDTAKLILKTNVTKGTGLITIERSGIIENRLISINNETRHIEVPILENYAPNVYVSVVLVQGRIGEGRRGKPILRMGVKNLVVHPKDNKLNVAVKTDKKDYRPGDTVNATVTVTDAQGKPVVAEVALTAADEGVLSLIAYQTPNPLPAFFRTWGLGVSTASQYAYIRDIPGPNLERPATGGDSGGGPGTARSRFMSTPVWKPGVVTNAQGIAKITFVAPDNLTAFRMMAVAADIGQRFGSNAQRFTVSKPLQLHQFLPRFLTQGDKLKGGVVVHNETTADGEVTVTIKHDEKVAIEGPEEQRVQVTKGGRIPVVFDMTATGLGETALNFAATIPGNNDAVIFKLPIRHPSPVLKKPVAEGATKTGMEIPLIVPADAVLGTTSVVVSVDPNGLAGIEEGLSDLIGYPYGCLEQTTSKVIPMLTVGNLIKMLKLENLPEGHLEKFVKAGIAKIGRHQTYTGGFSLWPGGDPETYYTAYALWGLYIAKKSGYKVDETRIKDGLEYLKFRGKDAKTDKPYYREEGHLGEQAFALYVRAMLGDKDTAGATRLLEKSDKMPIYGKAFLLKAIAADLGKTDPAVKKLAAELIEIVEAALKEGRLVSEPSGSGLHWYMSSDVRSTAVVLDALVYVKPGGNVVKRLARFLMQNRKGSSYFNTQENLYSLLALTEYAESLSSNAPTVTVAMGDKKLIDAKTLKGDDKIQIATLPVTADGKMVISTDDEVFYNVQLRYRQKRASIEPYADGMAVERQYLDKDGNLKTAFKVRDEIRVKVKVSLNDDVSHLAVSDYIPAGFEIVNTRFVTTGTANVTESQGWQVYRENRDERVDFSTEYVWESEPEYEYTMRAIVPGTYVLPPLIGELMYNPAVRARTGLRTITVEGQ